MKHFAYYGRKNRFIVFLLLLSFIAGIFMPYCMVETNAVDNQAYTISAECNGGGIISPDGIKTCYAGESQTYTFSPAFGYVIEDVTVDGVSKGAITEYTFYNIEANHTLEVRFSRRSGDLNEDGICDDTDISLLRDALLQDEDADTNRDGSTNVLDLVRGIRQKTLFGNALGSSDKWTVSNTDAIQFDDSELAFSGSGNALTVENFGQDYSVSAEVSLEGRLTGTNGIFSLIARRSGSSYYDYRLRYYSGSLYVDLYRYGTDGVVTELATYSKNYIQNKIGYRVFAVGDRLTMRLLCKGNTLYCFINECLIGSYVDADATAPKSGVAGIKINNVYGSVSGFEVQSAEATLLCDINTEDNGLHIYEGGTLTNEHSILDGVCVDGTVFTLTLDQAIISDYDNITPGQSKVEVSLMGCELPIMLTVAERRAEIDEISGKLEKINLRKLDASARELLQQYDELSEYEKTFCSDDASQKHTDAIHALALEVSNANDTILVSDTFTDESVKWGRGVELQTGRAFRNQARGRYQIDQTKYGMSTNCWRTAEEVYGEIHSVSADMVSSSVYCMLGLSINVGSSGYYYARVVFHVGEDGQAAEPTVKLFRKMQSATTLQTVNLRNQGIYLSPNSWFNMSLTCDEGVIGVYINGNKVIEYDDSDAVEQFFYGSAGVYTYAGDCRFDNVVVCGEQLEPSYSSSVVEPSYYEQNFEQEALGETVDEWMQANIDSGWKATSSNATYQITGTANYLTGLKGSSEWSDYCVEAKLTLVSDDNASGATVAGIAGRVTNESVGSKGYDLIVYKAKTTQKEASLRLRRDGTTIGEMITIENLPADTEFTLRLEFHGTVITGYLNEEYTITYDTANDATQYKTGYAGIRKARNTGFSISYNDFTVSTVTENTDTGESVYRKIISDDFNDYDYADVAAKRMAMNIKGWNASEENAAYSTETSYTIPSDKIVNLVLSKITGASQWTDYAVSCDVNMGQGQINSDTTMMIVTRSTNKTSEGYEFGICEDADGTTYFKLLKRAAKNVQLGRQDAELVRGRTYHLMMIVCENRIICYCDGKLIFDVTDNVDPYLSGYSGLRSAGSGDATKVYDNYIVHALTVDDNLSFRGQERVVLFSDSFEKDIKMTECGWYSDTAGTRGIGGDDNYCYGVVANEYTNAQLHVFENNPTVSLDFMYRELSCTDSDFGFEIRKSGDTAYVRIGYDAEQKKWYLQESVCDAECTVNVHSFAAELSENIWHSANIIADDQALKFVVDNETVFDLSDVSQVGYGKIAVYAQNTAFYIDNVSCTFPSGDTVQTGIIEYYMGDDYAASFEIESLDDGNMIGVGYNLIAFSDDYGKTFEAVSDGQYEGLDAQGGYMSMLKLHDGSYLFIRSKDFVVNKSTDKMQNWSSIGQVIPNEDLIDSSGRRQAIIHVNSLSEVKIDEDTWRILLPVAVIRYANDTAVSSNSTHYTVVYYSDDGGITWKKSENDTRDIILGDANASEWAEAKIIQCTNGELRMYCSHSYYGCMQYTVSTDGGKTWQGLYQIPEMQCPVSSFSITKDNDGVYYMVWVNDTPSYIGAVYGRGRLSLARSFDGMEWEFLCDIERTASYVWSDNCLVTTPLFQIVDPSITVTDGYVYVSYGFSDKSLEFGNAAHNAQRIKVVRVAKDTLVAKEWTAYNVSDMAFTSKVELTTKPQTTFSVGDAFVYAGGQVKLTALDGAVTTLDTKRFYLLEEPDMSCQGTYKVVLYNRNGFSVSYEITVR